MWSGRSSERERIVSVQMSVTSQELEEMRSLYLHDAHRPILSHYYEILSTHKSRNQRRHWYNRWNPCFVYSSLAPNPTNLRWRDIERFRAFVLHFPVTAGQRRQVMVPHCSPSASLCNKKATSGATLRFSTPLSISLSLNPPRVISQHVFWNLSLIPVIGITHTARGYLWLFGCFAKKKKHLRENLLSPTCVWYLWGGYLIPLAAPAEFDHVPPD